MICRWSRLNGQIIVIVILNIERIEKNGACRMDCKSKEKRDCLQQIKFVLWELLLVHFVTSHKGLYSKYVIIFMRLDVNTIFVADILVEGRDKNLWQLFEGGQTTKRRLVHYRSSPEN